MIIRMAANRMNPTAHPLVACARSARYPDGDCSLISHSHTGGVVGATLAPIRVRRLTLEG
jgi:hypothetical protein